MDATLSIDSEYLDDVLSTATSFAQIVSIWALVKSEKGANIQRRIQEVPDQLLAAVIRNIPQPHEIKVDFGKGAYGVTKIGTKPEEKLATIISIALGTKSDLALNITSRFAEEVIRMWADAPPDFTAAVSMLRVLDTAKWHKLNKLGLHLRLKRSLLGELALRGGSVDIAAFVEYADENSARWTDQDRVALVYSFEEYLKRDFDEELANCSEQRELEEMSGTLDGIASWCGVDIAIYQDAIAERESEIARPDDDDDGQVHQWQSAAQPKPESVQEEEVRRLFDGLAST